MSQWWLKHEGDQPLIDDLPSSRRKMWRVDLNDVRVVDEQGNAYAVELTRGELDGPLTVTIRSEDVPLSVAEKLARALELIVAHGGKMPAMRALAEYRAAYPREET